MWNQSDSLMENCSTKCNNECISSVNKPPKKTSKLVMWLMQLLILLSDSVKDDLVNIIH